MNTSFLSEDMCKVLQVISRLPGLGPKSAKRIVLHLMKNKDVVLENFINSLSFIKERSRCCEICGYVDEKSPCFFCSCDLRDKSALCIVATTGDVWAIEKAGFFNGAYHVLGGLLSTFEGCYPDDLSIDMLLGRIDASVKEVILALNSSIDGQSTMYYIIEHIKRTAPHVRISSLAKGMPIGSELDYIDQGTLMSAFIGRRDVDGVEYNRHHEPSIENFSGKNEKYIEIARA
ncbi:recombination mediator RecR [Candidatus Hydrogenosomobacter endosymbioticus]|uniref:Recombination protein RecR n=1 Tax=Candidatus Hydrogenosomobacter endosymbioticus TaxID=2558174 RepID=A0ABM7VA15_9PROT|nr:recombination mediator RecR [Candidatus Hydrogenosomobacter endosymbioticus]BDB96367.1 recombination protein RecR [Candidatus Hydrogenosomobacter endosymbioticus]